MNNKNSNITICQKCGRTLGVTLAHIVERQKGREKGRQTERQTDSRLGERLADCRDHKAFRRGLLLLEAVLDVLSEASDPLFLPSRDGNCSGSAGPDLESLEATEGFPGTVI